MMRAMAAVTARKNTMFDTMASRMFARAESATEQLRRANAELERQRERVEEINEQLSRDNQYKSDFLAIVLGRHRRQGRFNHAHHVVQVQQLQVQRLGTGLNAGALEHREHVHRASLRRQRPGTFPREGSRGHVGRLGFTR